MISEEVCELNSVDKCLVGALALERTHRMQGVADQYNSAVFQLRHDWIAIKGRNHHHILLLG